MIAVKVDHDLISSFCKRNSIRKFSFFGSVTKNTFRPESDVDVLIEFEHGKEPGLIGLSRMEADLSAILGRKVDLRTPQDLSRHFRGDVLAEAEVEYAE